MNLETIQSVREPSDLNGHRTTELVQIATQHTSPEILMVLAGHDNALVRAAVAGNPHIDNKIRALLMNDPEEAVKSALTRNTATASSELTAAAISETRGKLTEG